MREMDATDGLRFRMTRLGALKALVREGLKTQVVKALADPDGLLCQANRLFKDSARTKAGQVTIAGHPYFLKCYRRRGVIHTCKSLLRPSRPQRVFRVADRLLRHGVATPAPAALLEERRWGFVLRSYLVTEFVDGERPRHLSDRRTDDPAWPGELLSSLARLVAGCHSAGVAHNDLKANNCLLEDGPRGLKAWIVDLDGARLFDHLTEDQRLRDIGRLLASLDGMLPSAGLCALFLREYGELAHVWPDQEGQRRAMSHLEAAIAHHRVRHERRKGKPRVFR